MIKNDKNINTKPLRSFGRRQGRKLRSSKQDLFDVLLPKIEIGIEELKKWRNEKKYLASSIPQFPNSPIPSLWLEIGFGGGEHLAHQAKLHPDIKFIGCEPYINGVASLLTHIDTYKLDNIKIYSDDARNLLEYLPDNSLEKVFILYPDPWQKKRHNKRRIISTEFLDLLARVMKSGSELQLATDYADYATWMLERLLAHTEFKWTAKTCDDWLKPPPDWISTRYEQKALAGMPTYLNFVRF